MLIGDWSSSCCEITCWPAIVATAADTEPVVASVFCTAVFWVVCSAVAVPVARRGSEIVSVPVGAPGDAIWSATMRPARASSTKSDTIHSGGTKSPPAPSTVVSARYSVLSAMARSLRARRSTLSRLFMCWARYRSRK
jgi:hypothetical protein